MNIEVANRLVGLRKEKGLSQEALAEKLGISRQAVSKWERGEASPDTENLITLAKLYEISLDDLLNIKIGSSSQENEVTIEREPEPSVKPELVLEPEPIVEPEPVIESDQVVETDSEGEEPFDGIHMEDKDGSTIRFDSDGVFVFEKEANKKEREKSGDSTWYDEREEDEKTRRRTLKSLYIFPFPVVIVVLYLILGGLLDLWHPAWMMFLLIPLWYTTIAALEKRNANIFCFPVVVVLLFLIMGFAVDAWHPGWLIFLTIPIYYPVVNFYRAMRGKD